MGITRVTTGNFIKASDINQIIPLIVLKSTSATISSTGGKQIYICSPANATTMTLTLPTLPANKTRELIFIHGTTNTGRVKVKGDSSYKISGSSYVYLNSKDDNLTIFGSSNEWKRISNVGSTVPSTISVNVIKGLSSAGLKLKTSTGALGVFVANNGNIGVKTTVNNGALNVNGAIRSSGITLNSVSALSTVGLKLKGSTGALGVFVANNGNIGVKTTVNNGALNVNGAIRSSGITLNSVSALSTVGLKLKGSTGALGVFVAKDGSIGIKTTAIYGALNVNGPINTSHLLVKTIQPPTSVGLKIKGTNAALGIFVSPWGEVCVGTTSSEGLLTVGPSQFRVENGGIISANSLKGFTSAGLKLKGSTGALGVFVSKDGSIGIKTTSIYGALNVNGSINTSHLLVKNIQPPTSIGLKIKGTNAALGLFVSPWAEVSVGTTSSEGLFTVGSSQFRVENGGIISANSLKGFTSAGLKLKGSTGALGVFVSKDGSIGIKTTSIYGALNVNGSINTSHLLVKNIQPPTSIGLKIKGTNAALGLFVSPWAEVSVGTTSSEGLFTVGSSQFRVEIGGAISANSLKGFTSAGLKLKGSTGALGVFVANNGKVGVMTTSPAGLFDVGSSQFRVTTGGVISANSLKGFTSAGLKLKGSTGALGIFVANTGKVGVGTTIAEAPLHITSSANTIDPMIAIGHSGGGHMYAGIGGTVLDNTQNCIGNLIFFTRRSIASTSLTDGLRINYTGTVSIGTTEGTNKLNVGGAIYATEGRVVTGSLYVETTDGITENLFFDTVSPYFPVVGKYYRVSGAIIEGVDITIVSHAKRESTQIVFYGVSHNAVEVLGVVVKNGSTNSIDGLSLSW